MQILFFLFHQLLVACLSQNGDIKHWFAVAPRCLRQINGKFIHDLLQTAVEEGDHKDVVHLVFIFIDLQWFSWNPNVAEVVNACLLLC